MMVESKEQRNKLLQDCDHEFDLAFEMCLYEHEVTLLVLVHKQPEGECWALMGNSLNPVLKDHPVFTVLIGPL